MTGIPHDQFIEAISKFKAINQDCSWNTLCKFLGIEPTSGHVKNGLWYFPEAVTVRIQWMTGPNYQILYKAWKARNE